MGCVRAWYLQQKSWPRAVPSAAISSLPFAPEIVIPATEEMHRRYGDYLYSSYGFLDSFNPSFDYDIPLKTGRIVPGKGWVASDYIGIDQGPILAMIANYRNDFVWSVMKKNRYIRDGLKKAGFQGGWLDAKTEQAAQDAKQKMESAAQEAGQASRNATADAAALMDDAGITTKVNAGLAQDPDLSAIKIDVDTRAGVVTLNGPVKSEQARDRASQIAQAPRPSRQSSAARSARR